MNFRIGKIADLLGMSTEGLRLYERSGIVKPKRGEDNTAYRTYGHLDFTALIRARGYHYTGFSTKEIADLLNARSVDDILAGYEAQEEKIVQEQGESFQPLDCLSPLMDFVKGNGITVTDDPVSNTFLSMNKHENYIRFREVWLPIQE